MMHVGKQPERGPNDGPVNVERLPDGRIAMSATASGEESGMVASEYNAWRLYAALGLILGIKPSKQAEGIKL